MNHDYEDIRSRIPEPPKWFDECAVPRYSDFQPDECANIYARECVLLWIACQGCGHKFNVAMTCSAMDDVRATMCDKPHKSLADAIRDRTIHYGDPPNVNCCPAGPTMNSDPLLVKEFWRRDQTTDHEWQRDRSLEVGVSE